MTGTTATRLVADLVVISSSHVVTAAVYGLMGWIFLIF